MGGTSASSRTSSKLTLNLSFGLLVDIQTVSNRDDQFNLNQQPYSDTNLVPVLEGGQGGRTVIRFRQEMDRRRCFRWFHVGSTVDITLRYELPKAPALPCAMDQCGSVNQAPCGVA